MSHFLVFNNKNNYQINEILNLCKDFEVIIIKILKKIQNRNYNYLFIYPEFEKSELDPIKFKAKKLNIGKKISFKINSPIFYYESTGIAKIYTIWYKGKNVIKDTIEIYEEIPAHYHLLDIEQKLEKVSEIDELDFKNSLFIKELIKEYNITKGTTKIKIMKILNRKKNDFEKKIEKNQLKIKKHKLKISTLKKIFPYIKLESNSLDDYDRLKSSQLPLILFENLNTIYDKIYTGNLILKNIELTHNLKEKKNKIILN